MNSIERVRLTLLGNHDVGKTSIVMRYADGIYDENYEPYVNLDFRLNYASVESKKVKVLIHDMLYHSRSTRFMNKFLGRSNGIIVVYDVTNRSSFEEVDSFINFISEYASKDVCKLVIGNKCDMNGRFAVSYDEGKALADRFGIPFMETSAKTGMNIDQAFMHIISEILSRQAFKTKQQEEVSEPWSVKNCTLW